jgi:hypothetical protein
MHKRIAVLASLAVLAAVAAAPAAAPAAEPLGGCPAVGNPNIFPWALVGIEDPDERLADQNGDGFICVRDPAEITLTTVVVDDVAIGDPHISVCPEPFARTAIGNPNISERLAAELAAADRRGDGNGFACLAQLPGAEQMPRLVIDNTFEQPPPDPE